MKKIAILGGSHFIGVHLFTALHQQGHQLTLYNRKIRIPPVPYPKDIRIIRGDRNKPEDLKRLFHAEFDVVFDLSGYTPWHVQSIIDRYQSNIGHYMFCSTPIAYKTPTPNPYSEQAPRTYEENTYGGDKALVEELLFNQYKNNGWPITIFRPQGVFGPYDSWHAGFVLYRLIHSLPLFVFEESRYRLNPLYVDDLIAVFLSATENSISHGSAYGVAGDDVVTNVEFIELCGGICQLQPIIRFVETPSLYKKSEIGYSWFADDAVADCRKVKRELGVKFTALETALKETFTWLHENPTRMDRYS
jgi:nucleoside-diphosphate-sugar epimerase